MSRYRFLIQTLCLSFAVASSGWHIDVQAEGIKPDSTSKRPAGAETDSIVMPTRSAWVSSQLHGSPEPPAPYEFERLYEHLELEQPVILTTAPGLDLWFIGELNGRVITIPPDSTTTSDVDVFADMRLIVPQLTRIYGLTFHPQFAENQLAYVCYITEPNTPDGTHVSEFKVTLKSGRPRIVEGSERRLISWKSGGHNGGCLKFGPDGMLYICTGDGAPPSPPDPLLTGQDVSDLLASILRIDVTAQNDRPYGIPADNPFVDLPDARPEIYAYGFRNPWKISFDSVTGDLWTGDVGWELWELVYRVERGGNYGWSVVEGPQSVRPEAARGPTPILPATTVHSHTESRSVTGGFVYRGQRLPELVGAYIYGDYVTGKVWGLRTDGNRVVWQKLLANSGQAIIGFGEDHQRELYVLTYDGAIHRLVENPRLGQQVRFPTQLSQTGLFRNVARFETNPGVFEYVLNAPAFEDGKVTRRFVAIPPGVEGTTTHSLMAVHQKQDLQKGHIKGQWEFPPETVFARNVGWPRPDGSVHWVEMQILHKDQQQWRGYSYLWNAEQTDATLADADGQTLTLPDPLQDRYGQPKRWTVHSRTQCLVCHCNRAGNLIGFRYGQINRSYPHTSGAPDQLETLEEVGLIEREGKPRPTSKTYVDPFDESKPIADRARSYLHVNCAHCHRQGGGGTASFQLQYHLPLDQLKLLDVRPTQGSFQIYRPAVVASGDPYRSVLYYRLSKLGRGHMPHLGTQEIDERGVRLIRDWIQSLGKPDSTSNPPVSSTDLAREGRIDELLATTSHALRLADWIAAGRISEPLRSQIIDRAMQGGEDHIQGLFERFLTPDQRPQRLGTTARLDELLALRGDADRGRKLFLNTEGVQCKNCHQIGTAGRELGPRLDRLVNKPNRKQLLESILDPSRQVHPKYITYLVETAAGKVVTGLLVEQTEESIVLKQTDTKLLKIPLEEVELIAPQQKSLMPDLLLRDMTKQQVADLLEYLSGLN